ncbi:hypothetical protein GAPWKB30_1740 [Gilliamella apicola]|nr:hypothetical protein GAPWKB30_1740 [Gilliamella apicola]
MFVVKGELVGSGSISNASSPVALLVLFLVLQAALVDQLFFTGIINKYCRRLH